MKMSFDEFALAIINNKKLRIRGVCYWSGNICPNMTITDAYEIWEKASEIELKIEFRLIATVDELLKAAKENRKIEIADKIDDEYKPATWLPYKVSRDSSVMDILDLFNTCYVRVEE